MSLAYFPLYPDDFEADTAHLTLAEDGAFNRLLRLCWRTPGCSVPADRAWVYRRLRAHTEADQATIETVLSEFFREADGRLSNARLTKEWLAANEAHKRRKSAGAKGGKSKALKTNETAPSNASPMLKQPEPEPEPIEDTIANAIVGRANAGAISLEQPKRNGKPRGSARGSRIPPNWTPTVTDYAFASGEGLSQQEINREADRFRDYWTAKSGREASKLDWGATWRNWVRSDFRKPSASTVAKTVNAPRGAFDRVVSRVDEGASIGDVPERTDLRAFDAGAIDGEFRVVSAGDGSGSDWPNSGGDQADAGSLFGQRRAGHGG